MNRTAVVTGASSGIGRAVAQALVARGYRVIGTSRNPASMTDAQRATGVEYRALDLTDADSIRTFVADLGDVDVLVNNAGESQSGPFEELPTDAIERLFQLNVFGAVTLSQGVIPGMRDRGYGRIVMVGSMLASFPLAYRSSYASTKAAIKGFSDAARLELSPFGVWMTTVEPGSINTGISERRTKYIAPDSVHRDDFHTAISSLDRKEGTGISAEDVAEVVVKAIEADKPKPLYARGSNAPVVFLARRLLPATFMEKTIAKMFGLKR
ncbi:oxidoreductase [Rhodococcus sp. 15-725-2-2b]|uniref:SDR family oxidoreductase n=1 Tax=unclassified Rhodococcus (in: high G+C Gram-positive bacteria) TaxID=192944 RepID=UPI0005D85AF4|nr:MULTISPECIES: SDR family oxidoreductase [unclassified Rhodococcus (in: high G+C Gram-positive bacteria)]AJW41558.1 dehydrogenase [Rhodococcus sp. B7740]OZC69423.1 oxidoreductase [Rhodococcus sp. 06-469-3-2]OZD45566.1 oxidoreductase [Rhodococcus sp. 06-1477-1A]OZE75574.1 oxidoreductase [Rhodococcus sp. 15-725-2-2b]OZF34794.1 oxidoreductase [Rhodococcus sp. 14-2496-1d]